MPFEKLDTQVENAGADFFQEANSPDDILRFWRHGDAFPRLVIRPNGSLTGEIKVGNGASAPTSDLPATAIVDPTQLEPGGLTPIDWLGKIHLYDLIANRPAAGPTNEGSLFAASDTSILYLSDGAIWHAIAQLSTGTALEILDEGVSLDSAVTSINLVGTLITGTNVGHAVTITVATPTKAQVGLGNVTNDAQLTAAQLDTDGTLAANLDTKVASQKATKTYVDTGLALRARSLIPTALKTANYSAAANDFVPVDTTSGSVVVTAPTAPADRSLLAVKMVTQGGTNTVTFQTGGSDVINKAGGSTTALISLSGQGMWFQYQASTGIWYRIATDLALAGLDARYQVAASLTVSGIVELATTAEINTGTDSTRAMPVDQFVASNRNVRYLLYRIVDPSASCATGTTQGGDIEIPFDCTIVSIGAWVDTAGVTNLMTVDVNKNGTTVMATDKITLDSAEKTSRTAATPPALTTTALSAGDLVTVDIDAVQTTPAKGLVVRLGLRLT